jgi:hypothetical protein
MNVINILFAYLFAAIDGSETMGGYWYDRLPATIQPLASMIARYVVHLPELAQHRIMVVLEILAQIILRYIYK